MQEDHVGKHTPWIPGGQRTGLHWVVFGLNDRESGARVYPKQEAAGGGSRGGHEIGRA